MTVCAKAGCLWPLAKLSEKRDIVCCEGTVIRSNVKILRGTGGNVIADVPESRLNCICCLWNDFFLQGRIAEDVAFVLHVDALVYVSYINFFFNLLINLLYICKLGIV